MAKMNWEKINKEELDLRHKNQLLQQQYKDAEFIKSPTLTLSYAVDQKSSKPLDTKIVPFQHKCKVEYVGEVTDLTETLTINKTNDYVCRVLWTMFQDHHTVIDGAKAKPANPDTQSTLVFELTDMFRTVRDTYKFGRVNSKHEVIGGKLEIGLEIHFDVKMSLADTERLYKQHGTVEHLPDVLGNLLNRTVCNTLAIGALEKLHIFIKD